MHRAFRFLGAPEVFHQTGFRRTSALHEGAGARGPLPPRRWGRPRENSPVGRARQLIGTLDQEPLLIVAPKAVVAQWQQELIDN